LTTVRSDSIDRGDPAGHVLEAAAAPAARIACLAGHGIGPEVMAEASRALAELSRMHGFSVEEVHPPFGGEALQRSGHALPASTRRAILAADAVLVAGAMEPALEGVKADLDLAASMTRTLLEDGGTLTLLAPLHADASAWTIERAFRSARERAGRLVSVSVNDGWAAAVAAASARHAGIDVTAISLTEALRSLSAHPETVGVLVTEHVLAEALFEAPRLSGRRRLTATGLLSRGGPCLFAPTHGSSDEIAGQGVANPSEMLLAAALLLDEGIGRRAAAQTLEESLAAALAASRTPDMSGPGVSPTTREFVDVVLGLLPSARRDTEFAMGVRR